MKHTLALLLMPILMNLTFADVSSELDTQLIVKEISTKDGKKQIILENKYVRAEFNANMAGICTSLIHKSTGKDLSKASVPPNGIFKVWLNAQGDKTRLKDFFETPFSATSTQNESQATVTFAATGKDGVLRSMELRKCYTLYRNSSALYVSYELKNTPLSQATLTYGMHIHNRIGILKDTNISIIPTTDGILSKPRFLWVDNPSRGWLGVIAEQNDVGAVFTFDYPPLKTIFSWRPSGVPLEKQVNLPTFEWIYAPEPIECGKSSLKKFTLLLFSGLSNISGAKGDIAGEIKTTKTLKGKREIEIKLVSGRKRTVTLKTTYKALPGNKITLINEKVIRTNIDKVQKISFPFLPNKSGTYIIKCSVMEDGKEVCELETPFIKGTPSSVYTMPPLEKRLENNSANDAADPSILNKISEEYITPSLNWGKPYSRGDINVLFLISKHNQREIIEMTQRFDITPHSTTVLDASEKFSVRCVIGGKWYYKLENTTIQKQIARALTGKFDVIVIGG